MTNSFLPLAENVEFAEATIVSSESIFLPADAQLQNAVADTSYDVSTMRELASEAVALMGLSQVLQPRELYPDDVIMKPHEFVAGRDAAAPEQFFHVDVAVDGFTGILFIGAEGSSEDKVPETHLPKNAALLDRIIDLTIGGPLQDRLQEIFVVRPYFDQADRSEWMDYSRHVLVRLASDRFRELLTPEQRDHADRDSAKVPDENRSVYQGDVFIFPLISRSVIDGEPIATCGVGSREIRLALEGDQTSDETEALEDLHDGITSYLLGDSVEYDSQKVLAGSALFVPLNQLHRATPYDPQRYRRSISAIKLHPRPNYAAPLSWRHEEGSEY